MAESIEVWRIRPLRRAGDVASFKEILPQDEFDRADRQGDTVKRHAWITSRAALRLILSNYTRIPANELRFIAGNNGKPYLDHAQNSNGLSFNFSDSSELALLAVGWNRELGVDVERIREIERATEIAARRFAPDAAAELARAADKDRSRVFLQSWARHEALLKARAGTIWNPGGERTASSSNPHSYTAQFSVCDLDTGDDYVSALAAQGADWSVIIQDYSD